MKEFLMATALICISVTPTFAERIPAHCLAPCLTDVTVPASYVENCKLCLAIPVQDPTTGIKITNNSIFTWTCPSNSGGSATGSCRSAITYSCLPGWYGSAITSQSGCTKCPENATCAGGNLSSFVCNAGYYTNGTSCIKCSSATGNSLATSDAGALGITGCFLPSGTTVSNDHGIYKFTANCQYTL